LVCHAQLLVERVKEFSDVIFNLRGDFESSIKVDVVLSAVRTRLLVQHHEKVALITLEYENIVSLELLFILIQVIQNLGLSPFVVVLF